MRSVISHTSYARAAPPRGDPVARQSTRRARSLPFPGLRSNGSGTITIITNAAVGPQPMRGADGPPGPQGPPGNSGDSGVSFPEAPTDGNAYLRANSDWSSGGTLDSVLTVNHGGIRIQADGFACNGFAWFSGGVSCVNLSTLEIASPWDIKISTGEGYPVAFNCPVTLANDPANPMEAATKQYVDNAAPSGGPFLPLSGGTLSGSLAFIDANVPNWEPWRITNTGEASTGNPGRLQITRDNSPINILFEGWDSGGGSQGIHVLNGGTVTVSRDPQTSNEVATKNYVDTEVSSVWVQMTQAEYNALPSPNPNTLYVIVG